MLTTLRHCCGSADFAVFAEEIEENVSVAALYLSSQKAGIVERVNARRLPSQSTRDKRVEQVAHHSTGCLPTARKGHLP